MSTICPKTGNDADLFVTSDGIVCSECEKYLGTQVQTADKNLNSHTN